MRTAIGCLNLLIFYKGQNRYNISNSKEQLLIYTSEQIYCIYLTLSTAAPNNLYAILENILRRVINPIINTANFCIVFDIPRLR